MHGRLGQVVLGGSPNALGIEERDFALVYGESSIDEASKKGVEFRSSSCR